MGRSPGHLTVCLAGLLLAVVLAAGPAEARSYTAERFDSVVVVGADRSLDVTETVVFRFERGTFREVFREIPLRRTDGIEVIGAEIDGEPLPRGREPGTVEIDRRRTRVRIVWRFTPVSNTSRTFVLRYRVLGAVAQPETGDRLQWRSTPGEHRYVIEESSVRFDLPAPIAEFPAVRVQRGEPGILAVDERSVYARAANLRRNGWHETTLTFAPGTLTAAPPLWQQRAAAVQAGSRGWIMTAGVLLAAGLVLLVLGRHGYEPPPGPAPAGAPHHAHPPDTLTPALAGVLAANGQVSLHHAIAALFSLAARGEIEIRAQRRAFGIREFRLTRLPGSAPLAEHETAALAIVFKDGLRAGTTVTLSHARSRLSLRGRRFGAAATGELLAARLVDAGRQALRSRYTRLGIGLLVAAGALAAVTGVLLVPDHGAWPLLVSAALFVLSMTAFMTAESVTPLSNEGVRRASGWRAYRDYLAAVAAGREPAPAVSSDDVLPYALALGLAAAWAKYMRQQGQTVPAWFHAAQPEDVVPAFTALVATAGAGTSGASGTSAGGAAGGGASGAR